MPMYQALTILAVSVLVTAAAAGVFERVRRGLLRPKLWLVLLGAALALSAASALIGTIRHAGTGVATSYGWPKPFYFRYVSEAGERSDGWQLLYYAGNSLVFVGVFLVLWTAWRVSRR